MRFCPGGFELHINTERKVKMKYQNRDALTLENRTLAKFYQTEVLSSAGIKESFNWRSLLLKK